MQIHKGGFKQWTANILHIQKEHNQSLIAISKTIKLMKMSYVRLGKSSASAGHGIGFLLSTDVLVCL